MLEAVFFDLDGTLLVGEDLPDENARALRAAKDAGMHVIIATARWKEMAFKVADAVGLTDPVIACSGAQVSITSTRPSCNSIRRSASVLLPWSI